MSDRHVRWPSADGSPGIDFSPPDFRDSETPAVFEDDTQSYDASLNDFGDDFASDAAEADLAMDALAPGAEVDTNTYEMGFAKTGGDDFDDLEMPHEVDEISTVDPAIAAVAPGIAPEVTAIPVDAPKPKPAAPRTRRARLRLTRIDPWSVMKVTFLFSIAFGIMAMALVAVLWSLIAGSGSLDAINQIVQSLFGGTSEQEFRIQEYLNTPRVMGFMALISAIDVVIITAVSTLLAFLYNLSATILGGLEITLAED